MNFCAAVTAATAGNVVVSLLAFLAGRLGLLRSVRGKRAASALERCDATFARNSDRAVFVARLIPLARTFVALPAGHAKAPLGRFVVLTTAGCFLCAVAFVAAGVAAGESWEAVGTITGRGLLSGRWSLCLWWSP